MIARSVFLSQLKLNTVFTIYLIITKHINPLTPEPAITGCAKTHPQMPELAVTGCKKACKDNCLSYPPCRVFGSPIVLLLLRTNKPMRIDCLSIFLETFKGPRKMVFHLEIMHSKSAGNHGAWWAKSTTFQGLVFIPKREKLLLWHLNGKEKQKSMFRWPQNRRSRCTDFSNLSGEEFFFPSTTAKT